MNSLWAWVAAAIVCLCIVALVVVVRSDRQAYWLARTAPITHLQVTPEPTPSLPRSFLRR